MNTPLPEKQPEPSGDLPTLIQPSDQENKHAVEPSSVSAAKDQTPSSGQSSTILLTHVGEYELLEEVGRGGMGVVFRAQHTRLHRIVALKMLSSGILARDEDRSRFETEASAAAQLHHPNIVALFEVSTFQGQPYFCMEYVAGNSLAQKVKQTGVLPSKEAASLLEQTARAVHYAHSKDIIHRDLKPANILLDENDVPKITDFGLAKLLRNDSGQTRTGAVIGTPSYMAPEQANASKSVGPAVDTYSLGAILYELLTGHPPFLGETPLATLNMVANREPVPPHLFNASVDRDLETICLKCLEKEPSRRYANAEALADDLRAYRKGEPITARRLSVVGRAIKWTRRKPATAALLFVTMAAMLGFALFQARVAWQERMLRDREVERREQMEKSNRLISQREKALRHLFYLGQMRHAQHAWEDADIDRATRLLSSWEPNRTRQDLRDWEWYYLRELCRNPWTFGGHNGATKVVCYSSDGKILATAGGMPSRPGEVKLWHPQTGQLLRSLPSKHGNMINALAFDKDGQWLASASDDKTIRIWNLKSGQEISVLKGHHTYVTSVAFHPSEQRLLSSDGDRTMIEWFLNDQGQVIRHREFREHNGRVTSVAYSPDGRFFASASFDETVKLWNAKTGEVIYTLRGHAGEVMSLAFSPNSKYLLSGGGPGLRMGQVKLWNTQTGEPLQDQHYGLSDRILSVAIGNNGLIAAAGSDGMVHIWNKKVSSEPLRFRAETQVVYHLMFSPDGEKLATAGSSGRIRVWNSSGGQELWHISPTAQSACVKFSPDGKVLATADRQPNKEWGITLWNLSQGSSRQIATGHAGDIRSIDFSADSRFLATVGDDRVVRIHDLTKEFPPMTLRGHTERILAVAFHPDGERLATAGDEGDIRIWNIASGKVVSTLKGHRNTVLTLAFSPKGDYLASGGYDKIGRLWNLETEECKLLEGHRLVINTIAFSPDGYEVATGSNDQTIRIWEVASGKEYLRLEGATRAVTSLAYHPHGRRLASVGEDRIVRLWDLLTYQEIMQLRGPVGSLRSVAFDPSGRYLSAAGDYTGTYVWDARRGDDAE